MRTVLFIIILLTPGIALAQPVRIERNVARSKATLAAALAETGWRDGELVTTQGRASAGDGGGNEYKYDADSIASVDGVFVLPGKGGTMSYNSSGVFNGDAGDGRLIAIDKKTVRLKQAGAVADWNGTTGTDNTASIKAAVAACQTTGADLVVDGRYKITSSIRLPLEKPFTIRGRQGDTEATIAVDSHSEIYLETASNNIAAFEFYSSSTASSEYFHIRDFMINTGGGGSGLDAFTYADDGSTVENSRRGVKARFENLEIGCSGGYAFDFQEMPYVVQPVFTNIDVTGGGAIRITPWTYQSTAHPTSGMIVDGFHYAALNKIGPAFDLEGCRKTQLRNVISEGAADVDASISPYTGAIHGRFSDVSEGFIIDGFWSETGSGTVEAGATSLIFDNPAGANKAGVCFVRNLKLDAKYDSMRVTGASTKVIMQGGQMNSDQATPALTIDSGCRLVYEDYWFANYSYVSSLIQTAGVEIRNPMLPDHIATQNKTTGSVGYTWPGSDTFEPTIVYRYTGGYLANQYQRLRQASVFHPHTFHYPQNDIKYGSTILLDPDNDAVYVWSVPEDDSLGLRIEDFVGRQLFYRVTCRAAHLSVAATVIEIGTTTTSGDETGQGVLTNDWEWVTIIGSHIVESGDTFGRLVELDPATDPGYIQIAHLDIALDALPPPEVKRRAVSYTGSISGGPGAGTWADGDILYSSTPATDHVRGWVCTSSGTSRTISSVTCDTTNGSAEITNVANITELVPGDFISIAGVTGTFRIVSIDGATTATLNANADANTTGAAVSAVAPEWHNIPLIDDDYNGRAVERHVGTTVEKGTFGSGLDSNDAWLVEWRDTDNGNTDVWNGSAWQDSQSGGYAGISFEDSITGPTISGNDIAWGANKVQLTNFDTNFTSSFGATPDHTNDHITVGSAGIWKLTAVLSVTQGAAGDMFQYAFFKNNGATRISIEQSTTDSNTVVLQCLVSVSAADTLEIWVQRTSGSSGITLTSGCFDMVKVGD